MAEFTSSTITVPNGASDFDYDGTTYQAGSTFTSTDACVVLAFASAFDSANPNRARVNTTPNAWQDAQAACAARQQTNVGATNATPPGASSSDGAVPNGQADSGGGQGAPQLSAPPLNANGSGGGANPSADSGNGTPTPPTSSPDGTDPSPTSEPRRPPTGTLDPNQSAEPSTTQLLVNDPVDPFSGAFSITETDLVIANTVLPLQFTRTYRSGPGFFGPLGWNWDHNFNLYLRELSDGHVAVWRWMHEDLFRFDGAAYQPRRGLFEQLRRVGAFGTEWELVGVGGTTIRFQRPAGWVDGERIPVAWIRDAHGNSLTFTYETGDHLASVRDDHGNELKFAYDGCGLLVAVADHSGRAFTYLHDEEAMHLLAVTTPPTSDHPQGITRRYDYESMWAAPRLRHAIVRVIDGENRTFIQNTYDEDPGSVRYGRVIEQYFGGYLHQYDYRELQVVPNHDDFVNVAAWQAEVMNPDFGVQTYTFNFRGDLLDERLRLVKDGSYRVVARQYRYDRQGQLAELTRPDGSSTRYTRDDGNSDPRMRGLVTRVEELPAAGFPVPSRVVWQGAYDPDFQRLIRETDETGRVTTYVHDFDVAPGPSNSGKLMELRRPAATLPDGTLQSSGTKYEYAANGLVTAVVNADGVRTEFTYGAGRDGGRVVQQLVDPPGLAIATRSAYDAAGFLTAVTDPTGATTINEVNALGQVERTAPPNVGSQLSETVLHYDADRRPVRVERPRGDYDDPVLAGRPIEDLIRRDELGNPAEVILGANTASPRVVRTAFDYRSAYVEVQAADGSSLRSVYDERGLLVRQTRSAPDGAREELRWAYDRVGRVTHEFGPLGLLRRYEYDPFGRLRRVIHRNGTEHEVDYGPADRPVELRVTGDDGGGVARLLSRQAWTYDELGRERTVTAYSFDTTPTAAVALTTIITYDALDRPVEVRDHRSGLTTHRYDAAGRRTVTTDADGNSVRHGYDPAGRVTLIEQRWQTPSGPTLITREDEYDARGRLIAQRHADGSARAIAYDHRDLPVDTVDEVGVVTRTVFNAFAERTAETVDPAGLAIEHRWTLDAMGRSVAYRDPTGEVTVTEFDGLGRAVGHTFPAGNTLRREHGADGLVAAELTGAGNRFEYHYDPAGRLARVVNTAQAAGAAAVLERRFSYDGLDRLVLATVVGDPAATVARRFDSLGRLRSETSAGVTITRDYDDLAGVVETAWPDGRSERATLDPLGLDTLIEQAAPGALGTAAVTVAALAPLGPRQFARVTRGAVEVERAVDERGRLSDLRCRVGTNTIEHIAYRFDLRDRLGLEVQTAHPARARLPRLDEAGRLVSVATSPNAPAPGAAPTQAQQLAQVAAAAGAPVTHQFMYDAADTLVGWQVTGQPAQLAVQGPGHRYALLDGAPVSYLPDGAVSAYPGRVVTSDALGRVSAVTAGTATSTIAYDALQRVAGFVDGAVDERWVYFGSEVLEERRGGTAVAQYTRGLADGSPLCRHVAGARQLPLLDLRGSLRAVLSELGAPLAWYDYAPYGAVSVLDAAGLPMAAAAAPTPALFGGMRHLPTADVLLAGRRVLEPRWGVFLTGDPFGYADSANLYIFAGGDPSDRVDPNGDLAFLAVLGVMAVGALVGGALNATRQGIAMSENPARRAQGFSWGELAASMGIGAVAAPLLVVAPELAVPMVGLGLLSGANEFSHGNYATGTFDVVTAVLPFASKNVRTGTFGRGTAFGQRRGLGPGATMSERVGRFDTIAANPRGTLEPAPLGEDVGIGIARPPGTTDGGHSGAFFELPDGPTLFHKNAQHSSNPAWVYEAAWMREPLPSTYFNGRQVVPWEYTSSRVPRSVFQRMFQMAQGRQNSPERFAFKTSSEGPPMSCGYYTADVFAAGGVRNIPAGNSTVVHPYVSQFLNARNAASLAWGSGFWAHVPNTSVPNRKCAP